MKLVATQDMDENGMKDLFRKFGNVVSVKLAREALQGFIGAKLPAMRPELIFRVQKLIELPGTNIQAVWLRALYKPG